MKRPDARKCPSRRRGRLAALGAAVLCLASFTCSRSPQDASGPRGSVQPARAGATAGPPGAHEMPTAEYSAFVAESLVYLAESMERCKSEFQLGEHESFVWDQPTATLTFSDGGKPTVVAHVQFVGLLDTAAHTWSWAWAVPDVAEPAKEQTERVRQFGASRVLPQLTTPQWEASHEDAWAMTAVAARILEAKGAYRAPSDDHTSAFLVFTDIARAAPGENADEPAPSGTRDE